MHKYRPVFGTMYALREKCSSFPAFGLNMERYVVSLRIQSEFGKIQTRKNSLIEHFSRREKWSVYLVFFVLMIHRTVLTTTNTSQLFY